MESRNGLKALGMALVLAATANAPTGCASSGDASPAAVAPMTDDERDARIRELEAAIAVEEEALRELISGDPVGRDDPLITSDEMREIANRLPALQDELRGLLRAREISSLREKRAREPQRAQDP